MNPTRLRQASALALVVGSATELFWSDRSREADP